MLTFFRTNLTPMYRHFNSTSELNHDFWIGLKTLIEFSFTPTTNFPLFVMSQSQCMYSVSVVMMWQLTLMSSYSYYQIHLLRLKPSIWIKPYQIFKIKIKMRVLVCYRNKVLFLIIIRLVINMSEVWNLIFSQIY